MAYFNCYMENECLSVTFTLLHLQCSPKKITCNIILVPVVFLNLLTLNAVSYNIFLIQWAGRSVSFN